MVRGHPDYWSGSIPGMPTLGAGQEGWFKSDVVGILGFAEDLVVDYTVPAGHELYITGAVISCDFPYIHKVTLYYGEAYAFSFCGTIYFNTSLILPVNGWNRVVVEAGCPVKLACFNMDADMHSFSGSLVGFLQEKE